MYKIILLSIWCFTILTTAKVYEDCGSDVGSVVNISFTDCDVEGDRRCKIIRNKNYTLDFLFTVKQPVESLNMTAWVLFLGAELPFPVPNPKICDDPNSGVKCPLLADGTIYHYRNTQPVPSEIPRVVADLKVEVKDEKQNNIFCMIGKGTVKKY